MSNFSQVSAQLYVGGNVSFEGSTMDDDTYAKNYSSNYLRISPQIGYFISENLLIGLGVGFSQQKSNRKSEDINSDTMYINSYDNNYNSIVIDPFLRHYIKLSEKVQWFNQLGIRYSYGKHKSEDLYDYKERTNMFESKYNNITAYLKPSISIQITEKLSLDLSFIELFYSSSKYDHESWTDYADETIETEPKEKGNKNQSSYGLNYNSIDLGLSYKF